ncbi:leukemia inhibitory factor receptor-like [Sinocyclocheilus grahami]|uniref:leukemia inhibitory factor receptor-like n=1 Tax=Sinocyclocheilus grahami TaxID=75366 RepID=UPI0007AD08D3|nr:PREDICTED: leukemia inhibitory factor receptor-like [Sinocyclocheilus grahami]
MEGWVTLALLLSLGVKRSLTQNGLGEPPVPRGLTLNPDLPAQTLTLRWQSDSSLFDLEIFHTELMNVVLNVSALTSLPLSFQLLICVVLKYAFGWSDIPVKSESYMFPQDKMVPVGSNMSFCCIVKEKEDFKEIVYGHQKMNATRLSRRTYAITVTNQPALGNTGTNVICFSQRLTLTGAVVFVGSSAECSWKKGRDTRLRMKRSRTKYTLNGRDCLEANEKKTWWCSSKVWEENWTLVARNPLGTVQLTDSAQLTDRVHLLAPANVTAVEVKAWSATLLWSWSVAAYKKLEMVCQLRLFTHELSSTRNYGGPGSAVAYVNNMTHSLEFVFDGLYVNLFHVSLSFVGSSVVPSQSVSELSPNQIGSDVLLSWRATEMKQQRGFIRGYTIYLANAAHLDLIANITDPEVQSYRVKGLSLSSYKFVVKAYTSAGEDAGATVSIKMEMDTDMLFVGILVPLGIMFCCLILVSICCYKKREWVKKAFYPEIPGPKVPGDWSSSQGPLDVKPSPHSLVHIVESPEWDFTKEGLFPVPEEEEEFENDNIEVDTDSDEPALLRYYNQVVGDGSHSNQISDSSGSSTASVGSTQTEITYAGIQSPTSSQGVCGGGSYKPQMQSVAGPKIEFEADFQDDGLNTGYKPQGSWQLDSPEAENFSGSLGSPTSVTSSQFLIPESSEEQPQPPNTWFHNLLSGKS